MVLGLSYEGWFPPLFDLVMLGAWVYCFGVIGILINRCSLLHMLMCLELALLGLVICFASVSICNLSPDGQLYALLILVAAASESAVGLALIVLWTRVGGSLNVQRISRLKG